MGSEHYKKVNGLIKTANDIAYEFKEKRELVSFTQYRLYKYVNDPDVVAVLCLECPVLFGEILGRGTAILDDIHAIEKRGGTLGYHDVKLKTILIEMLG